MQSPIFQSSSVGFVCTCTDNDNTTYSWNTRFANDSLTQRLNLLSHIEWPLLVFLLRYSTFFELVWRRDRWCTVPSAKIRSFRHIQIHYKMVWDNWAQLLSSRCLKLGMFAFPQPLGYCWAMNPSSQGGMNLHSVLLRPQCHLHGTPQLDGNNNSGTDILRLTLAKFARLGFRDTAVVDVVVSAASARRPSLALEILSYGYSYASNAQNGVLFWQALHLRHCHWFPWCLFLAVVSSTTISYPCLCQHLALHYCSHCFCLRHLRFLHLCCQCPFLLPHLGLGPDL